ncbi:unnamed protein product [Miscanthus lutarioriparius]|uniref:Uncharacterized protein n=1 Tax=Miscanthus lutarioriparius TaxID=422564 RepID=A0A811RNL1_9POAL|nr:unnamed protein product [Miscanthus lutarioriparius]
MPLPSSFAWAQSDIAVGMDRLDPVWWAGRSRRCAARPPAARRPLGGGAGLGEAEPPGAATGVLQPLGVSAGPGKAGPPGVALGVLLCLVAGDGAAEADCAGPAWDEARKSRGRVTSCAAVRLCLRW